MALWLALVFLGLMSLGFVFHKVWTASSAGIDRRWFALALGGTLIAVVGLVMTLRSLQSEPAVNFIPRATIDTRTTGRTPANQPTQPGANTPSLSPPESNLDVQTNLSGRDLIPRYDPEKFPEEEDGELFTQEEIDFFVARTNKMISEIEKQVTLDLQETGDEIIPKYSRWLQLNREHHLDVGLLRRRALSKNGPGTGRVRQLVFRIAANTTKMLRIYHNSVVFPQDELNLQYIAQLQEEIERMLGELQKQPED